MKKDTILMALVIGLAVFLMRWFRAFTPIENYEIHFLPLFLIYLALRLHFKRIKMTTPAYDITFLRAFWLGIRVTLIASVFTWVLCLLFVQYPAPLVNAVSQLFLLSSPFFNTLMYGSMVSVLCSAGFVYFKPFKIKHDTNFKLHTGHHLMY
jgi:hypothetical protein